VGISIDGTEEIHDRFRGLKGSFRESIKAIELLNSFGLIRLVSVLPSQRRPTLA